MRVELLFAMLQSMSMKFLIGTSCSMRVELLTFERDEVALDSVKSHCLAMCQQHVECIRNL